jgi:hypothetical protein
MRGGEIESVCWRLETEILFGDETEKKILKLHQQEARTTSRSSPPTQCGRRRRRCCLWTTK